jgi:hypothetical protein
MSDRQLPSYPAGTRVGTRSKGAIAVLALALAVAFGLGVGSAQAYSSGPYSWGYTSWSGCTKSGSTFGQGYVGANAFVQVNNTTSTNHMEIWFSRQYLGTDNQWHQDRTWKGKSSAFGDRVAAKYSVSHTFPFNNDYGTYRLVVEYRWYDNHIYGDSLLYSKVLYGNPCTPL